ncbi:hypothetical protein [Microbacterium sp. YY-01]|uniref:hypothetical protein n=1 Tax=Microbacterium sp. YY-01 TaxID=3421634 RepID=UPI003D18288A
MAFKDTAWAYGLSNDLSWIEKAVLVAVCHHTDDATHEAVVSVQTIGKSTRMSRQQVLNALETLEKVGVISRTIRRRPDGYRGPDVIRVNVDTYTSEEVDDQ